MPEDRSSMDRPPPVGIALLVCDSVYQERSGKRALIGLFDCITATKFPVSHSRMTIFAAITDIRPNTSLKIDIVHGETDEKVFEATGPPPDETTPTKIVDLVFEIDGVKFPEAATYFVRLFGNGQILLQRPFELRQIKAEEPDVENDNDPPKENDL